MGPKSGVLLILLSLLALSQGAAKGADETFRLSARATGGATGPCPHGSRWSATRTETAAPTWWRSSLAAGHLSRAHIAPGKMGAGPRAQQSLGQRSGRGSRRPVHGRCCRRAARTGSRRLALPGLRHETRHQDVHPRRARGRSPRSRRPGVGRAPSRLTSTTTGASTCWSRAATAGCLCSGTARATADGRGLMARWRSVHQPTPWKSTSARLAPGAPTAGMGRCRRSTQCRHNRLCRRRPSSRQPRALARNRQGRASGGGKVPRPRRPRHHRRSPTPQGRRSRLGRRDSSAPNHR